jgi:hypothetical protein
MALRRTPTRASLAAMLWLAVACGAGSGTNGSDAPPPDAAGEPATEFVAPPDVADAAGDAQAGKDAVDAVSDLPAEHESSGPDLGPDLEHDVPAPADVTGPEPDCGSAPSQFNVVLGRPTDTSIAVSVLAAAGDAAYIAYGPGCASFDATSPTLTSAAGEPLVIELTGLAPDTRHAYRLHVKKAGQATFVADAPHTFHTQRAPGRAFHFGVQGDSHPERLGKMFSPDLYTATMKHAAAAQPDFYVMLGDDFSIERLLENDTLTQANVDEVYLRQRDFTAVLAHSTALFLVNGNHEQVAGYLLTGNYDTTWADAPIFAGKARLQFFPLPAPDGFYTGDVTPVEGVGLLRDYYAFTWGDALFVTVDPYWHSPVPIDTGVPGIEKEKDGWKQTIGDEQYQWLKTTLEGSPARWKFVFEHHVLGNGRGGAAMAHQFEWGGYDKEGEKWQFDAERPTWAKPMHPLFRDTGVTVFFFGHDHVFAREKVDGVVYQSVPNPADDTYTAWNSDAYDPETIPFQGAAYDPEYGKVLPDSGYLDVAVAPEQVTVSYVRAVLPGGEALAGASNGEVSFSYSVE